MKKKLWMVVMIAILAIAAVACSSNSSKDSAGAPKAEKESEELTIKHQLGETKVKKNPQKVVVFDFGALDTLDKLGVEVAGVPQKNIPPYLSKYKDAKYQNVGGLKEPDFEKINEINPDLIIISGRQQDSYQEFTKIAPTIFIGVDTKKYMESFTENTKTLGQIFGKESQADQELAKVNEDIKKLNEKATASGKNALIILANDGKVSAYGAGSRFGIIHDVFGLTPVDKNIETSTHGQSISFEYIVEKDPDYLFVIDRGAAVGGESSAKQVVENELVKKTKAFKNNHIVYLDPNYWYLSGGGLVSVEEMVKEVGAAIK
ncbi:siderophore ABC transporter substrate-binding protein [Aneurinibacillus aneurinilyticus]|jgi:iron complex transport system substrate-binding protein|uniref:siderophore ABC transporter substrate-binding protein n=1 Tax=Aneurinibacillus aneurinilyticus TaxID=1391 RepID=UPI0023FA1B96|nr:siderophore ABC transporter substrate-binding protein [Aneurinibacillus aneurinilyticus]MCI1693176.1 siderophore ABC transporter substrate-binding protein [Aneurinibacillus aneurinilyticus]